MYCLIYIQNKSSSFNLSNDAFNINWCFFIGSHDYDLDVTGTATSATCVVTVSDGDLTDTASLVITINDVNDHTPRFTSATFTFYAQPNTGVGTALGFITASDNDAGAFGWFIFRKFLVSSLCDKSYLNFFVLSVIILFVFYHK